MPAPPVTVLVPLKQLSRAKSRLRGAMPGMPHEELVLALAHGTVSGALAARSVGRVVVVTDDPVAGAALALLGADIWPDLGQGLNGCLRAAALKVTGPVAALPADLPALCPDELDDALARAGGARGFVPDAAGTGTVLLTAPTGPGLDPRFGAGSAAAHERSGARLLAGPWPSLRQDVDTEADLSRVRALGWHPGRPSCPGPRLACPGPRLGVA